MDNYDSNMIKPIDSLQNVTGMAPTRRREQRRRKQDFYSGNKENQGKERDDEIVEKELEESINYNDAGDSQIDFRA